MWNCWHFWQFRNSWYRTEFAILVIFWGKNASRILQEFPNFANTSFQKKPQQGQKASWRGSISAVKGWRRQRRDATEEPRGGEVVREPPVQILGSDERLRETRGNERSDERLCKPPLPLYSATSFSPQGPGRFWPTHNMELSLLVGLLQFYFLRGTCFVNNFNISDAWAHQNVWNSGKTLKGRGGGGAFPIQKCSLFVFLIDIFILNFGHKFGHIW